MDFLDGMTLKDFVEAKGKIPEGMAVKWMLQIVQTMGYLHSEKHNKKPIFYRDMKPENIMIRPNGTVNIFDFGISIRVEDKNQKPDYTLGTPGYVALQGQVVLAIWLLIPIGRGSELKIRSVWVRIPEELVKPIGLYLGVEIG